MSNMWARLVIESILGFTLLIVGVVLIGVQDSTTSLVIAIVLIVVGIAFVVDLFWAASSGRIKTPSTLGAGMAVAGSSNSEKWEREQRLREAEGRGVPESPEIPEAERKGGQAR